MNGTIDTKNPALPSYECEAYQKQMSALTITRDLCGGTLQVRSKGELYLPREPKEETEHYNYRLKRAILFNAYQRGKEALVGMVFDDDIHLGEDVPLIMRGQEEGAGGEREELSILRALIAAVTGERKGLLDVGLWARVTGIAKRWQEWKDSNTEQVKIEGQLEDCDLNGTHISVFAKEFFSNAIDDGHCFLYVDMQPRLPDGATAEDEVRAGRRPYFVKYRKDQAVNWRLDARGNLQQITFKECTYEAAGEFGEEEVIRYRVLTPGRWRLFRVVKSEKGDMVIVPDPDNPEGVTSLDYVPVSVCYTRKTGVLQSNPMLIDAAITNIAHYQKYSDYSIYLHINSRPLLWFRNRDKAKPFETIGPYSFFDAEHVDFAEPQGTALGAARTDLIDLQEQMSVLLLSILAKKTVNKTATEERGDQRKEESALATAARSLKDCFEQALTFWADYINEPTGGSIEFGSVEEYEIDPQTMTALSGMAGTVFSTETVRQITAKGLAHLLPETYSEESEAAKLEAEAKAKAENAPDIGAQLGRAFNAGVM